MLDTERQREEGWSGEGGGRGAWEGHLPCLAAGRHSDVSPPTKGPDDRIFSAVAFSKHWLC